MLVAMKVDTQKIVDLRPASDSSADIAASLHRAEDERVKAAALLAEIQAARGAVLVSGTAKEVEAVEQSVSALTRYIEDLDIFTAHVAPRLPVARTRERVAAINADIAALDRPAKTQAFVQRFREVYPAAAKAIADMLALESEAIAATERENILRKQLEALGEEPLTVQAPYRELTGGGSLTVFRSFGHMVRLPGVMGAPAIPVDNTPQYKTVYVERPDWDNMVLGRDGTGKPRATKIVPERVIESYSRATREDTPFWWPNGDLERALSS